MWWCVSLTFISHLSDHGNDELSKSISQYLLVLHSSNFHQLFIFTWSTYVTWCFVSLTYISRFSDQDTKGNSGAPCDGSHQSNVYGFFIIKNNNNPPPILRLCIAFLRSPKGGCCSISDDLSCSYIQHHRLWLYYDKITSCIRRYNTNMAKLLPLDLTTILSGKRKRFDSVLW